MVSEKGPEFRIIGNAPEAVKETARNELRDLLLTGDSPFSSREEKEWWEQWARHEIPKSEEESMLLALVNQKTNELMEKSGIAPYDVSEQSFHLILGDIVTEGGYFDALTFPLRQAIVMAEKRVRISPLVFFLMAFHELLHLKSHLTLEIGEGEVERGKRIQKSIFREGVGISSPQKKWMRGEGHEHFRGLNEAIIATEKRRFYGEMASIPLLGPEWKRLNSSEVVAARERIGREYHLPLEDIIWVSRDGEDWRAIGSNWQRKVYDLVCIQISEAFPEKYPFIKDVRKEFLKSFFGGNLLSIGHLVEKVFGKGSFRALGSMDRDDDSAIQALEGLRSRRRRLLKERKKLEKERQERSKN